MDKVPFEKSTHIQVSFNTSSRLPITASFDERERVFLKNRIDNKVYSRQQIHNFLDISVNADESSKLYTFLDGSSLFLYEIKKVSDLTEEQKEVLDLQANKDVMACDKKVFSQLPTENTAENKKDCVLLIHSKVPVQYVNAELRKDEKGIASDRVVYKADVDLAKGQLIKISKKPKVDQLEATNVNVLDPLRSVAVSDVMGKEYLFRRTLEDTANHFRITFPGIQGALEIVKFRFEKERMVVYKSDTLRPTEGTTNIDLEELLSIPATYLTVEYKDSKGQPLDRPVYRKATFDEPGAVAVFDWRRNTIPDLSSPLNYYSVGSCFLGSASKEIADIDMRLKEDGILNFSVKSTRALNPRVGCSSYLASTFGSYFYPSQAVYNFRERISFKEYNPYMAKEEPILDIPYHVQKLMNFGIFTFEKRTPNEFGNLHTTETRKPLPMLRDFRNGNTVTYVLAGIPKSGSLREKLIKKTKEVVNDWNQGFHKAFKGTSLQRSGDYVKLLVEGDDLKKGHLGDLDRNYIYYVEKAYSVGILGIGGPSANPRSGIIEASDVILYGGNLKSSIESSKIRAKSRKDYKDLRKKLIEDAMAEAKKSEGQSTAEGSGGEVTNTVTKIDENSRQIQPSKVFSDKFIASPGWKSTVSALKNTSSQTLKSFHREDIKLDKAQLQPLVEAIKSGRLERTNQRRDKARKAIAGEYPRISMMEKILEQATKKKAFLNLELMEQIVNEVALESYKDQMTKEQYNKLHFELSLKGFTNDVIERINNGHQIVEKMPINTSDEFFIEKSLDDLLVFAYGTTLSHELGHSFGLRHNFWGSYDEDNWHDPNEESSRNYSSIMDYIADDIHNYDGIGLHDIYSLRAAYTGMVGVKS